MVIFISIHLEKLQIGIVSMSLSRIGENILFVIIGIMKWKKYITSN